MTEHGVASAVVMDQRTTVSLGELCVAARVDSEVVIELVSEGVLEPLGDQPAHWRFSGHAVARARRAVRLAEDLRLNLPGVALALELMDELESLREIERHR